MKKIIKKLIIKIRCMFCCCKLKKEKEEEVKEDIIEFEISIL